MHTELSVKNVFKLSSDNHCHIETYETGPLAPNAYTKCLEVVNIIQY